MNIETDRGRAAAPDWTMSMFVGQRDDVVRSLGHIKRRWRLVAAIVVAVALATTIVVFQVPPRYTAHAKILVDPRSARFLEEQTPVMPGMLVDRESIESEIQIITSRHLAGQLVDRLNLIESPDFNPTPARSSFLNLGGWTAQIRAYIEDRLGVGSSTEAESGIDPRARIRSKVIDAFSKDLTAVREGQSRVITVSMTAKSPVQAADIANAVSEYYLVDHLDNKLAQRRRTSKWLEQRLAELKTAVAASDRAVEDYRRATGLLQTQDDFGRVQRLDTQQLTKVSSELIDARADRTHLEAKLREAEASRTRGQEDVPEVISSNVVGQLRAQETRVTQRIADLQSDYGARHPRLIAAENELVEIRTSIKKEIGRIIAGMRNELARARARESALENAVKQLERKTADQNSRQIRLNELAREAEANQQILEQFMGQTKQIAARQALQEPDSRIIAAAEPPVTPSWPKKQLILLVASLGALLLGCALVLFLERVNSAIRTESDVEEATGLRVVGVIPSMGRRRSGASLTRAIVKHPSSHFAEAMRSVHTSLLMDPSGAPPKSILFTSAYPGEGKSTVAACFARAVADQGLRVVIIDADLRRPQISKIFGLGDKPGLIDLLTRQASLQDVLQADKGAPLCVIPSGNKKQGPANILAGDGLAPLFAKLGEHFDLVVVDTPPILVVSDALLICRHVDTTAIIVRWNDTGREDVVKGVRQLREVGANIRGIILNAVKMRAYAGYAYGKPNAYMRAYSRYYRS
ncbi:MAG: polysaccharide biosynthesis tyrosine autokinase [Defluviicoccus sp.]